MSNCAIAESIDKKLTQPIREIDNTDTRMEESRVERLIFTRNCIPRRYRSKTPQRCKTPEERVTMTSLPDRNIPEFLREQLKRGKVVLSEFSEGNENADDDDDNENAKSVKFDRNDAETINKNFCFVCKVHFRFDTHFQYHCEQEHGDQKAYRCPECMNGYKLKKSLTNHMKRKHFKVKAARRMPTLRCHVCAQDIQGHKSYEKHCFAKHAGVKMMECLECPNKFYRRAELLKHVQKEHMDVDLKCRHCRNIFARTDFLKEHEEYCSQLQKLKGSYTTFEITKKSEQIRYEEYREKISYLTAKSEIYPCCKCEATFSNVRSLDEHLDARHAEKGENSENDEKYRRGIRYTCPYCRGEFAGVAKYEKHGKKHPGKPLFHCQECGRGFNFRRSLRDHFNEKHSDDKTSCSYCSKCYFKLSRLRDHEALCAKKFKKIARFQAEGRPRYHCDICGIDLFVKINTFRQHLSRHHHYDNCPVCGDRFHRSRNPGGLVEHFRMRHPLQENIRALLQTVKAVNEKFELVERGEREGDANFSFLTAKDEFNGGGAINNNYNVTNVNFKAEEAENVKKLLC